MFQTVLRVVTTETPTRPIHVILKRLFTIIAPNYSFSSSLLTKYCIVIFYRNVGACYEDATLRRRASDPLSLSSFQISAGEFQDNIGSYFLQLRKLCVWLYTQSLFTQVSTTTHMEHSSTGVCKTCISLNTRNMKTKHSQHQRPESSLKKPN